MEERDFTIELGGATVPARVPVHMTGRFRVNEAIAGDFPKSEGLPRLCAILGMCWAGDPLVFEGEPVPSLRSLGYDLVEYGDYVLDALMAAGVPVDGLADAALECHARTISMIPTPDEVEEAAAPFEAPAEDCTATT